MREAAATMTCFLTSSLCGEDGRVFAENDLIASLRDALPPRAPALFICSDPDGYERTARFAGAIRAALEAEGFSFASFGVLDGRNAADAASLVRAAGVLILAGGHVPTQNRFFRRIGLRTLLEGHTGVLIGISAGSMNSARTVYACPELPGEAVSAAYPRFLPGLGLTETMILPHYQKVREEVVDGLRTIEDIVYPDSAGRCFIALPDSSYLYIHQGREELRGEAYRIQDGVMTRL